jgi:hypothetical protein
MSRFDEKDLLVRDLEDSLIHTMHVCSILQDALEQIASDTEEDSKSIAIETLEALEGGKK